MLTTADQLATLYELQRIDAQIAQKTQALDSLDDGTETEKRLHEAKNDLEQMEDNRQKVETEYQDKSLKLESIEREREDKANQAYEGTISDPKRLSDLEKKIAELDRRKDALEDEILQMLEESEAAQEAVQQQRQLVDELTEQLQNITDRYAKQSERLEKQLAELQQQRQQIAPKIDESLIQQYEALREKLDGVAVATVSGGSCDACNVRLPSAYLPRLEERRRVVRCDNCRRILYMPETES